jgi:hypothetical protein
MREQSWQRLPEQAHHQGHQQADEVPVQNNCGKDGFKDESDI